MHTAPQSLLHLSHCISQTPLKVLHLQSYFKAGLLVMHRLRKGTELAYLGHMSPKVACDTRISLWRGSSSSTGLLEDLLLQSPVVKEKLFKGDWKEGFKTLCPLNCIVTQNHDALQYIYSRSSHEVGT